MSFVSVAYASLLAHGSSVMNLLNHTAVTWGGQSEVNFMKKNDLCLADPGEARGCSTNTFVIDSLIHQFIHPLVKLDRVGPVGKTTIWGNRF